MQDEIHSTNIIPSVKTDNSGISLSFRSIKNQKTGPSYWKFNSSLVDDPDYVNLINMQYPQWIEEFKEVDDKRVLWDVIKYKIRQETMGYSKVKAKQRRQALDNAEKQIKQTEEKVDLNPTAENVALLEICKTNYEKAYEYITKGSILRSRVRWYEEGEKNTKYFLNLENQ